MESLGLSSLQTESGRAGEIRPVLSLQNVIELGYRLDGNQCQTSGISLPQPMEKKQDEKAQDYAG